MFVAHLVKLVDTSDLKSGFVFAKYWFNSNNGYRNILANVLFNHFRLTFCFMFSFWESFFLLLLIVLCTIGYTLFILQQFLNKEICFRSKFVLPPLVGEIIRQKNAYDL
jgi:hypothetical protein